MLWLGKTFAAGSHRKIWLGVCFVIFASLLADLSAQAQSIVNNNFGYGVANVTSVQVTLPSVSSGNLISLGIGWCANSNYCQSGSNTSSVTVTVTDSAGNTITEGVRVPAPALPVKVANPISGRSCSTALRMPRERYWRC